MDARRAFARLRARRRLRHPDLAGIDPRDRELDPAPGGQRAARPEQVDPRRDRPRDRRRARRRREPRRRPARRRRHVRGGRAAAGAGLDPEARRRRRGRAVPRRGARGVEGVPAADLALDDDRLLRDRELRGDVGGRPRAARCDGSVLRCARRGRCSSAPSPQGRSPVGSWRCGSARAGRSPPRAWPRSRGSSSRSASQCTRRFRSLRRSRPARASASPSISRSGSPCSSSTCPRRRALG